MCPGLCTILLCPSSSSSASASTTTANALPRPLPYARTSRTTRMHGASWPPRMSWISRYARMHGTYGTYGTTGSTRMSRSPSTAATTMPTCLHSLLYENLSTTMLHCSPSPDYASSPTTPSPNASLCSIMRTNMLHGQKVNYTRGVLN